MTIDSSQVRGVCAAARSRRRAARGGALVRTHGERVVQRLGGLGDVARMDGDDRVVQLLVGTGLG